MKKDKLQALSERKIAINDKAFALIDALEIIVEAMPAYTKALRAKYLNLIEAGFTEEQTLFISTRL